MTQKVYTVEGRRFRTQSDYARALRDKKTIDALRSGIASGDRAAIEKLCGELKSGKYHFYTMLGEDFREEMEAALKEAGKTRSREMENYVKEELRRRERRRKLTLALCSVLGVCCFGYLGWYSWQSHRTESTYEELSKLKEKPVINQSVEPDIGPLFTLDEETEPREVLDEYKNLLILNKKLIGWVKIDDTSIDYPVMQTSDNEYYLNHNMDQGYDNNGSIFMDKDCDVIEPSTNLILYGHHMKSGKMFGGLDKYQDEEYYKNHKYIDFDTIYEKGIYEVMYVFRSRVYSEDEVVFKYYRFIDAVSEIEFNSNMNEMAAISLYDTGVTASYGDRLLTLSTCDYQEKNGRFVVVAKKVSEKE